MKTAEIKTANSAKNPVQTKRDPFFNKEGQGNFFSKSKAPTPSFFNPPAIQPKLTIGQPNDKYEVEADAMADKVVQHLSLDNKPIHQNIGFLGNAAIQTKCNDCEGEETLQKKEDADTLQSDTGVQLKPIFESNNEPPDAAIQTKPISSPIIQVKCSTCGEEDKLQKKEEQSEDEMDIQTKSTDFPTEGPPDLQSNLNSSKGSGSSLSSDTQSSMGSAFGADFSNVRVHTGSEAVQMNKGLGAHAFTHGNDIYFNEGKYDTNSTSGQHLLAHELTHTVQQGATTDSIQKQNVPEEEHLESLNEMLDRFDVPEEAVISLLRELTPAETITVTTNSSYKNRMADAYNIGEMVRAVVILNLTLEKKLEWIEAAAGSASNIDYSQIQALITTASQPDRDVLKTNRWRDFFIGVCTNETIIRAVTDLHFDLKTQLEWIEQEASPSNLHYSQIQALVTTSSQPDRDVLKTNRWRNFFIGVCTNETILEAVNDLQFDLKTKIEWVRTEAGLEEVKQVIELASQADRDVVWNDATYLSTLRSEVGDDYYLWVIVKLRMLFVGTVSHTSAIDADTAIQAHLSTYVSGGVTAGRKIEGFVAVVDSLNWDIAGEHHYGTTVWATKSLNGFVDSAGRVWIEENSGNPGTMVHEAVHKYSSDQLIGASQPLNEGVTEYFTRKVCNADSINITSRINYQDNWTTVTKLVTIVGEVTVASAYFDGDVTTLESTFVAAKSASDWTNFITETRNKNWIAADGYL